MTPTEAGFDGAKGINLNHPSFINGGIYRLPRGSKDPRTVENYNFKRQLLWVTPPGCEPELWYCNDNNEFFLLSFDLIMPGPTF
jgi:hypothetical protein